MLAHPALATTDMSSLAICWLGGSPVRARESRGGRRKGGSGYLPSLGQTESGFPLTFMSTHDVAEAVADPAKRHRLYSCGQQTNIVAALEIMDDDGCEPHLPVAGVFVTITLVTSPQLGCGDRSRTMGWKRNGDLAPLPAFAYLIVTKSQR